VDAPTAAAAARRRALLRTLERALHEAVADSAAMHRAIWELQREGLQLRLTISCEPAPGEAVAAPSKTRPASGDPAFRIGSDDLAFLRSIGIDPTRSRRRARKS
jgi:hypothetical protein